MKLGLEGIWLPRSASAFDYDSLARRHRRALPTCKADLGNGRGEQPLSALPNTDLLLGGYPRLDGKLYRVFPGPGVAQQWPLPRQGGGGPVLYSNFLKRYWRPAFKAARVRYATHHSARHSFVSTLQAQGVEVGLRCWIVFIRSRAAPDGETPRRPAGAG